MKLLRLFLSPSALVAVANDANGLADFPLVEACANDGKWITVNGRHILLEKGETVEEALAKDSPRASSEDKTVPSVVTVRDPAGKAFSLTVEHDGEGYVVKNKHGEKVPGKRFSTREEAKKWAIDTFEKEVARRYHDEVSKGTRKGPDMKSDVTERQDKYQKKSSAANDIAVANALGGEAVFNVQQGNKLFVPYGRYQHPKGMQIFDKESAEIMASVFNSLGAKIGRFFTGAGAPIYAGHPDVPGRADSNPAAPAFGWVEGITAENDGASFDVKWNPDGENAVGNAHFRFYSAHWNCRQVKGGIQPVQLLSIGLTNNPRIPVPAIANDDNPTNNMNPELLKLLGFAADATPSAQEIATAISAHNDRVTAANDELALCRQAGATIEVLLAAEIGETTGIWSERIAAGITKLRAAANDAAALLTAAQNDLATANASLATATANLTAANDRATAERTARVNAALEGFTTTGRITAAEIEPLRTELVALENDALETRLTTLAKAAPKLNTKPLADVGGARKTFAAANDEAERSAQRRTAIDAELTAIANDRNSAGLSDGQRYDKAFNRAQKKHPDLFPTKAIPAAA